MFHHTKCFLILILLTSDLQAQPAPNDILESNRQLVTGIDVDAIMKRYVTDYHNFEKRSSGIAYTGNIYRWSVKPDPNDPETLYYWGKNGVRNFIDDQFVWISESFDLIMTRYKQP